MLQGSSGRNSCCRADMEGAQAKRLSPCTNLIALSRCREEKGKKPRQVPHNGPGASQTLLEILPQSLSEALERVDAQQTERGLEHRRGEAAQREA